MLIIVDVQNDFLPGGSLAITDFDLLACPWLMPLGQQKGSQKGN
jgi:nicotinamidase-related amidase